jgi:hypothetical protein
VSNKNARVIIPLALFAWAGGILASQVNSPVLTAAWVISLAVAIPVAVFYLMAEQGWSTLAKLYRSHERYSGPWQPCATGSMSTVSIDDASYPQHRLRLVSTLRVATTPDALQLSMLFSKLPLLGRFFPDVSIPWREVTSAREFEAPGWVTPASQPGAILRVEYDPNYRGTFVELVCGQPPVFLQLPASMLGDYASKLDPSA